MLTMRGWLANTSLAPAACKLLEINQAKLWLSPTPVTRATLPARLIGIMIRPHEIGILSSGQYTVASATGREKQAEIAFCDLLDKITLRLKRRKSWLKFKLL